MATDLFRENGVIITRFAGAARTESGFLKKDRRMIQVTVGREYTSMGAVAARRMAKAILRGLE